MFDDMLEAWRAAPLADGEPIPRKKAFKPATISQHLHNIGLAEHLGEGRLRIRLAGSNSWEFWGSETTGADYHDMPGEVPDDVMMPPMILMALFNQPCGMRSLREAVDNDGNIWQCDMFSLPFANDEGIAAYLLYGYRIFPVDESRPQAWEPGFADLSTATLLGATFVDLGFGVPG